MDADRFDLLTKSMAAPASRRRALGVLTAGGLFGGLTRAWGSAAAQGSTCTLDFVTTVRLGPTSTQQLMGDASQPGEVRGELSFGLSPSGALEDGSLVLTDGTSLPVVGQATGRSLQLRIDAGQGLVFVSVGVGEQEVAACQGAIGGMTSGPQAGDLGDWQAVAIGQASSPSGAGGTQPPRGGGQQPGGTQPPRINMPGGPQPSGSQPSGPSGGPSGPSGSGGTSSCPPGESLCNGACVDLEDDDNNCGECGDGCSYLGPDSFCQEGTCVSPCPIGQILCNGTCVDNDSNENCGTCGNVCGDGENCIGGSCVPADCGPELTDCGGVCVDTSTDGDNCGACGNICETFPRIFNCDAGVCVPPDCGPGLTDCSGLCDDVLTSTINCGTCGNACLDGELCSEGECVVVGGGGCNTGLEKCPTGPGPLDFVCVNIQADTAHCGACGQACAPGSTCQGGQCFAPPAVTCNPGLENCFGTCVDTSNDAANCGGCGVPCPAGQACQGRVCVAGIPDCPEGTTACGGVCLNVSTDPFACGACTNVCPEGNTCEGGVCTAPAA